MKKPLFLLLVLSVALAVLLTCSPEGKEELEGYWEASLERDGHNERYVYHITTNLWGKYTGSVQSYLDGYPFPSLGLESVEYAGGNLEIVTRTGATIVYRGQMSAGRQRIEGKLHYPDGSSIEFNLLRQGAEQAELTPKPLDARGEYHYVYQEPAARGDGLVTAGMRAEDISVMRAMMSDIVAEKYGNIHSVLIARGSELVFEEYFYHFTADMPHHLQSATKSITSLLVGIAMDMGHIGSEGEALSTFFPEYAGPNKARLGRVTLEHILTMTSGWSWTPAELEAFGEAGSPVEMVLSKEAKYKPGEKFEYMSPNMQLLAPVLKKATGLEADAFAARYLFAPLGIQNYTWERESADGHPLLTGALFMTPRDMLKIGLLVLNRGEWSGRQVVSAGWIEKSTAVHAEVPNNIDDYGYLWWHGSLYKDRNAGDVIFASGRGGQFIFILPEQEMVVVFTGGNFDNGKEFEPIRMLQDFIVRK